MIRAAIICPDKELAFELQEALSSFRNVGVARLLHQYPNEVKLPAFLKATTLDLIFLSTVSLSDAIDVAARIRIQVPGTPVVAFSRDCDGDQMLEILRAGIKDFVAPPFASQAMDNMLRRMETLLDNRPEVVEQLAPVFAFLPAKAGAGATTIAVNTSVALVRVPERTALLIDLDLNSGLVGFMLSLDPKFSVTDAAENAPDMDEALWSKIVTSVGSLDVLPSGVPKPGYRIESSQIRRILEFAQRNYSAICVDLSGMMEKYSLEVLQHAKQIFLVCTPELACLHLARAKLGMLRRLELADRAAVLMNRAENSHRTIPLREIEKLLGQNVSMSLPNAYETTRQAGVQGKSVKPESELGKCFVNLGRTMLPEPKLSTPRRRRGILDMFRAQRELPQSST